MRPRLQLIFSVVMVVIFAFADSIFAGLSAFFGVVVSMNNAWLLHKHTERQKKDLTIGAHASIGLVRKSVLTRISYVLVLMSFGLLILELNPFALIMGLAVGQIGFLLDSLVRGVHLSGIRFK